MGAGTFVVSAIKGLTKWVVTNPDVIKVAADKIITLKSEDKINQLGEAVLELEDKFNTEIALVNKQLRIMKILLLVMGVILMAAVIAIICLMI